MDQTGVRIWTWGASSSEEVACDLAHGATGFQMCTRKVDNGCLAELYAKALKER